jgi:hypothetical protein
VSDVIQPPAACPFCGGAASIRSGATWVAYECLSSWHRGHPSPRALQSEPCKDAELKRLYKERDDAIARALHLDKELSNAKSTIDKLSKNLMAAWGRI